MENIIFIWDGPPKNYINICLESLRLYNKNCKIHFYYSNNSIINNYEKFNIKFKKIDEKECKNKLQYYKVLIAKNLCYELELNSKILILDFDILFQNDPFLMFKENPNYDFYYTHCLMSKPDSLRPESLWKSVIYKVNGGVWGLIVNKNSKKLMDFWINNLINETWEPWINYPPRQERRGILNWDVDQDFLNCIDLYELPFELKKVAVSYKYNYFVSTWGHYNEKLNMGNKIGNPDYVIIHFKANFKDTYNLNNQNIYNMKDILEKKDLTTEQSRKNIYNKFLSRGERRFHII